MNNYVNIDVNNSGSYNIFFNEILYAEAHEQAYYPVYIKDFSEKIVS